MREGLHLNIRIERCFVYVHEFLNQREKGLLVDSWLLWLLHLLFLHLLHECVETMVILWSLFYQRVACPQIIFYLGVRLLQKPVLLVC